MSPCTPCFRVIFSREDIASFGMVHLLYLSRSRIIAKVRKRKVVHASKTHLTRAVFLRANRKNRLFTKKNFVSKEKWFTGDCWLFFAGFTASGGGDADKVRCGANTRAKVTQFRDQEAWRADASTRGGYGRGSSSMDDGHQGGHWEKRPSKCRV